MSASRDRRLLAIGSDVRLVLVGFGTLLAVGLASGIGVGLLSSRQLTRAPQVAIEPADANASLSASVHDAWDRLRQIAQMDWRAVVEPARQLAERTAVPEPTESANTAAVPVVSPEEAARRVAEGRHLSPRRTALRANPARTVDAMLRRFDQQGFDLSEASSSGQLEVPRIFLTSLPLDIADVSITEKRKRAFINVMLPHILRENERITADRQRLEGLHERLQFGGSLSQRDQAWLQQLANRYGLDEVDIDELLNRVDVIPPGLALAQAVEESGWGTSRFAQLGNAVYGQWTWNTGSGIVPENRPDGETYEVQRFSSLENSVAAYMRNLNTRSSYREFREARAKMRDAGADLDSYSLASHLRRYSVRGEDYIRTLRSIMRSNSLDMFDGARLASQPASILSTIGFSEKS
ncbi:MAG TPA: glucosaminidase domain-containing protein [Ferrovibrio sp.]|uniref:glucosaminidase domain-containing protein n=1 Tax=Ferrovibrio sp. TaxID=1917215 RepID=UPI002ED30E4D